MDRPEEYETTIMLNVSFIKLTELPSWVSECKNLEKLECNNNKITQLDNLPLTLEELGCSENQIAHLDNLPYNLKLLYSLNNPLKYDFEPTLENIRNYITQNTKIEN